MIENVSREQLAAMLDALPFELVFVDADDRVQYANKMATRRLPPHDADIVGKDLRLCHKRESLPKVEQILSDLRSGKADEAGFWVPGTSQRMLNRFVAVWGKTGQYVGILQYLLDFGALDQIAKARQGGSG